MKSFMGWKIKFSNERKTILSKNFDGVFPLSAAERAAKELIDIIDPNGLHIICMPTMYGFPDFWNSPFHRYNGGSTRLSIARNAMARCRFDHSTGEMRITITR